MGDIRIELKKDTTISGEGGRVTLYVTFPHFVGIVEATRFSKAMAEAISLASRWQDGSFVAPSEKSVESSPVGDYHSKGGKARAESLTPERRSEIAQNAAGIRWQCKNEEEKTK
jgi:hypothetical protein